jgi:hypothetical protein
MVVGTTSGIPAVGGAEVSPGPRPDGRRSPPVLITATDDRRFRD